MRLRPRRQNPVIWSSSVFPDGRFNSQKLTRPAPVSRFHTCIRIGRVLTLIGLMHLARVVRPRWQPILAGGVLTIAGIILRTQPGGVVLLPGLLFLLSAPLIPGSADADRKRRAQLEFELSSYSTPAQRHDLEATLDRYPDDVTDELRNILARQALPAWHAGIPGAGQHED